MSESNQRPVDNYEPLQSTALPSELMLGLLYILFSLNHFEIEITNFQVRGPVKQTMF